MGKFSERRKVWMRKMRNKYRLVIMHDETFELKTSVKLSAMNVFVIVSTVLVVFTAVILSIIIFTPIKNYIVGYEKVENTRKLLALESTSDSMLRVVDHQQAYLFNLQRIIRNEADTTLPDEPRTMEDYENLDLDNVPEEDLRLRQEVEEQDQYRLLAEDDNREFDFREAHFFLPIQGTVTSAFDPAEEHYGIDIVAVKDSPIKAVLNGTVIDSYWSVETGNVIVIQHDDNLISLYKHNSKLLKKTGNFVRAGDAIAIIGNTGELSSGPHLHFELWHDQVALNPEQFMVFN